MMERFYDKVDAGPGGGCHLWAGAKRSEGRYGQVQYRGRREGAHRVAWELAYGAIPEGLLVLHRCDRSLCVNPEHLFLGTQSDNMKDKVAKDRHPAHMRPQA